MYQPMTPTDNPLVSLKRQEKKRYLARIYQAYKLAWKNGALKEKPTAQLAKATFKEMRKEQWWANNLYSGCVEWVGEWAHISFKRHDRGTEIPWQHKQWIKNDILGKEWEAVEMFPAESRLLNTANQYHLWGTRSIRVGYPVGFVGRDVGADTKAKQTLQRRDDE